MMFPFLAAPPESAQVVYDRLQARLASVAWAEFVDFSLKETNSWTEYRVERPHRVAFTTHSAFAIYESDGVRTTNSMTRRNRPARFLDVRVPPGWEALVGGRGFPSGEARKTPQGTEIDLRIESEHYLLRIDRGTGLPAGYRIIGKGPAPDDPFDFRYGQVHVHAESPADPIHVAAPKSIAEFVGPFAAWLGRQRQVRLRLTHNVDTSGGREEVTLGRDRFGTVPGFDIPPLRFQFVGIRWLDATHEGYVARTYDRRGWTDAYYATGAIRGIHFPIGYVRVARGKEIERVAVEIEG